MTRACASCGAWFLPAKAYHKRCLSCWREGRDRALQSEAYAAGVCDWRASAWQPPIDADLLRELVVFCHPDRHDASKFEEANRLTSRLLALREGRRAA
jgi:hypothetical protein